MVFTIIFPTIRLIDFGDFISNDFLSYTIASERNWILTPFVVKDKIRRLLVRVSFSNTVSTGKNRKFNEY